MKKLLASLALFLASSASAQINNSYALPLSSPAMSASWVVSITPIAVYRLAATSGNVSGYLLVFDQKNEPADGPVVPLFCRPIQQNANVALAFTTPMYFRNGLVLVFSTTGCYTKTASPTAYFEASPK